jgi:carbonic anhydrase/acetyltransferase-like protein (isoleucine patch superfamily)
LCFIHVVVEWLLVSIANVGNLVKLRNEAIPVKILRGKFILKISCAQPKTLKKPMIPAPSHLLQSPFVHPTAWVAPTAAVLGNVTLAENVSVFYSAVIRGDINEIRIGPGSNIQDGCVLHLSRQHGCYVGSYVTVGHKAVLHACTIGDECLIGMGAIILDGAEIGARSIIGAGSLVTSNKKIPPGSLVMGSPAKVVRQLSDEEQAGIKAWADSYVGLLPHYRAGLAQLWTAPVS